MAKQTYRVVYQVHLWNGRSWWRGQFIAMGVLVREHKGGIFVLHVTQEQDEWIEERLCR